MMFYLSMRFHSNRESLTDPRINNALNFCTLAVILEVFAKSSLAFPNRAVVADEFYRAQVLDHLVAKQRFDAQAQRRSMLEGQRLPVHLVGQNRLRMARKLQIDHFVIGVVLRLFQFRLDGSFALLEG